MAHQEVGLVSCPHCGTAFEVFAPDFDRRIKSITTSTTVWGAFGDRSTWTGCPHCRLKFYVNWKYQP